MTQTTQRPTAAPTTASTDQPGARPATPVGPRPTMQVVGPAVAGTAEILTPDALDFLAELHGTFLGRRHELLVARERRRAQFADGVLPDFLTETAHIRDDPTWRVAGAGPGLEDRRVEITGPTDRKMAINALNSGAKVWLADQEDATSPTWENVVGGQLSLHDAVRGELSWTSAEGKRYDVGEQTPTIVMRPRGWHLAEKHLRFVDRAGIACPASGSLVDFGLYVFHNARRLVEAGTGPYVYLAKLENHLEARLWNDVFVAAQGRLGLPRGTVRATVLIETVTAAFEMEEILYELRGHCAGLNAGRWDYIFSMIKNFRNRPDMVLPDRGQVTMTVPFMRSYTELLVATCHKRGAHAIGGMSAFIPNRRDPEVTARALDQVRADKEREAGQGYDGTWVAHPDLVPVAREVFDRVLGGRPNQLDVRRADVEVVGADLLAVPAERIVTEAGVRANVSVALRYLEAWLRGTGAVAIDNLMEDAATAEISRSQLWQWIHHGVSTVEGTTITHAYVAELLAEILATAPRHADDRYDDAGAVLAQITLGEDFPAFLTLVAYPQFLVRGV